MPGFICKKGNVGVISKSGTLTYEAIDQLVNSGLGQTTAIGIGGDPIIGTTMRDCLQLFEQDDDTDGIVIIGGGLVGALAALMLSGPKYGYKVRLYEGRKDWRPEEVTEEEEEELKEEKRKLMKI